MFVLPMITNPASIRRCAMAEFFAAVDPTRAIDPQVVLIPSSDAVIKQS